MITIHTPKITEEGENAVLFCDLELNGNRERLWYKVPLKFRDYLVTENADAFLVGLLFLGLKTGEDIAVTSAVSARLHYTLTHYLIPALCLANPEFSEICLKINRLNSSNLNTENVAGSGLSCGVDSFATYFENKNENGAYKIEYFTFLNAGSLGDFGGENTRRLFREKLVQVKRFAEEEQMEVIPVDSNLSDILGMNFQSTHTLRNLSCILTLQKLFSNYYYATPHRFDKYSLNKVDTGDYDLLNTGMLSTESVSFFPSSARFNRIERTKLISGFPETYAHLDVCTNSRNAGDALNCSVCHKCMRTQLTLDLLGKLDLYEQVFNLEKYRAHKSEYIGKLLQSWKKDEFAKEIYAHMKASNRFHKSYYFQYLKAEVKDFKKYIKTKL